MNNRKDIAFTVELLGLFILLTMVITIVAGVFVMSRSHSLEAKQLNEAVILAQNAAEVSSAAPEDEALADMLHEMDNNKGQAVLQREGDEPGSWNALYATVKRDDSSAEEQYIICVTRKYPDGTFEERADRGAYAEDTIEVYAAGDNKAEDIGSLEPSDLKDPVYTLVSGTYFAPENYAQRGGRP